MAVSVTIEIKIYERMDMKKIKMITYSSVIATGIVGIAALSTPAYSTSITDSIKSFFKVDESPTADKKSPTPKAPVQKPAEPARKTSAEEATKLPVSSAPVVSAGVMGEEAVMQKLVEEPNNVNYLFELGQLKILKGDIAGATNTFNQLAPLQGGGKYSLIGLSLIDLFLGQTNEAYKRVAQSSLNSDPEVQVISGWCMLLGGNSSALDQIIQNAAKTNASRASLGTMAIFYAITGNYDLANVAIESLSQNGFLPSGSLIAKFLLRSKFGADADAASATISELRNKFQLSEEVARTIVAAGALLELNYSLAKKQYEEIAGSGNTALAENAKRMINRFKDVTDPLMLSYHRSLTGLAVSRKDQELLRKVWSASPRATLRLISSLENNKTSTLDLGIFSQVSVQFFGADWYQKKYLSLIEDETLIRELSDYYIAHPEADRSLWRPWDYVSLIPIQEGKKLTQEEFDKLVEEVSQVYPENMRDAVKFEFYIELYSLFLIRAGDIQKVQDIYQSPESFQKFLFTKLSETGLKQSPTFAQANFDRRVEKKISKVSRNLKNQSQFDKFMGSQKNASSVMEDFRRDAGLTIQIAKGQVDKISETGCMKPALEYYISKRFSEKDTSTRYQAYLTCVGQLTPELKDIDRSAGVFIETLYNNKEYSIITKFFRENESWITRSNPYSAVHYIDSLGRTEGMSVVTSEAKRICAIVSADFCVKINTEVMPELEKRSRLTGISKANELLGKAQAAIAKKNYEAAKPLLLEARAANPLNPFIYMYFESIYRADNKFDFLAQYTELVTTYLTTPNIDPALKPQLQERIFKPCEDVNLPCETLVTVVRDGRFDDVPAEVLKAAFAAQLIRLGELEAAKKIIEEMTQSENVTLQRKGLKLKTTLTEIFKRVQNSSSFDKKILQEIEKTSI